MSEDRNRNRDRRMVPQGGIWDGFIQRIKLILRLMADDRVSIFLKILPVASFTYVLFPDLAPGPIDDAAVIWLGMSMFVELCPPEVVQEHMEALNRVVPGEWRDPPNIQVTDPDASETRSEVIEAEFRDES